MRSLWILLACIVMLTACSSSLSLSGKRCPCVDGYVCDEETNLCVLAGAPDASLPDTGGPDGDSGPPPPPTSPPVSIVCGGSHTCALFEDSTVKCWGANESGQLGYRHTNNYGDDPGEIPSALEPVDVGGDVVQLSAGLSHTCALLTDGGVRCWGHGGSGRLGYGSQDNIGDIEPPSSAGSISLGGVAVQVVTGAYHSCALLDNGKVRCWGEAQYGQLGYGDMLDVGTLPGNLPSDKGDLDVGGDFPLTLPMVHLAAGWEHTCGYDTGAAVHCWGRGFAGALGYVSTNNIGDNEVPSSVVGSVQTGSKVSQITAGNAFTCAFVGQYSHAICWGWADKGRLGQGGTNNIGDTEQPRSVAGLDVGGDVMQIVSGADHACALLDDRSVVCWGSGEHGKLGYGNLSHIGDDPAEVPSTAGKVEVGGLVKQLALGQHHTCALLIDDTLRCWGLNDHGQLGYGDTITIGDNETPASVPLVSIQ